MEIIIRLETPKDYKEVEILTREAFWDVYMPGCDEHLILHKLREVPAFIRELDFVACDEDRIVGNIVYSKAKIINNQNQEFIVLSMGPISVLPSLQRKGIGSLLIKHSINRARELGYKAVIIFGNHDYYHRFGFENAQKYGIATSKGENFNEFMALELYENSLKDIQGKFYADDVFQVNNRELEEFEQGFPYKEKNITNSQLR